MELNAKPLILWILYHIIGLDGFRIGNVDSSITSMQVDKSRIFKLRQYSRVSPTPVNNRLKRFFEFNPLAFNRKSSNRPEQTFKTKFHFSPFITSLQNFKHKSVENEEYPFKKFKSNYINNAEKSNSLRPYVDHFSGVKSFTFHLKNPKKEKMKNANTQHVHQEEPAMSKLIVREFLKPKTEQLLQSGNLNVLETGSLDYEGMDNGFENSNFNGLSTLDNNDWTVANDYTLIDDDTSNSNIFGKQHSFQFDDISYDDPESLSTIDILQKDIENYAPTLSTNESFFEAIAPKLKKFPNNYPDYDSGFVMDNNFISSNDVTGENSEESADNYDFQHIFARKQHESNDEMFDESFDNSEINYDITPEQSLDNGFNPFGEIIAPIETNNDFSSNGFNAGSNEHFFNEINHQGNNENDLYNGVSVEDGFDNFGIFEGEGPSNDQLSFMDTNNENSKPYFGIDAFYEDNIIDPFEEGFGSFSYDDTDCDNINTKMCYSNSDCSCYGLYQCHENRCTSNIHSSDNDLGQSPDGLWHEEPVVFDSWGK